MIDIAELLPRVIDISRTAGNIIMSYQKTASVLYKKEDFSPVTEADREADTLIVGALRTLTPDIPVVSEEGEKPDVSQAPYFWLVDPLDGTKSFLRGKGYFTVNVGLIENRKNPVLGVIYDPANKAMYYGSAQGAFREYNGAVESMHVRKRQAQMMTALISHSHLSKETEEYLQKQSITIQVPCASSIKFCMLAQGTADVYPRFGTTMEWDIAAGHAILNAAGGKLTMPDDQPFLYGKKDFVNGDFIASN